mgnify:CR=1 FL=1
MEKKPKPRTPNRNPNPKTREENGKKREEQQKKEENPTPSEERNFDQLTIKFCLKYCQTQQNYQKKGNPKSTLRAESRQFPPFHSCLDVVGISIERPGLYDTLPRSHFWRTAWTLDKSSTKSSLQIEFVRVVSPRLSCDIPFNRSEVGTCEH